MIYLIQQTIIYALPLMIVALAGVFSERSGVINLALEGTMIIGAFIGVLFVRCLEGTLWLQVALIEKNYGVYQLVEILALLVAGGSGIIFSFLLSFAAIKLKADQTISGTALNMIAPALAIFLIMSITSQQTLNLKFIDTAGMFMLKKSTWGIDKDAQMSPIWNLFFNKTYLATYVTMIIYAILSVILYKTRFGLRLRSCGENPEAAASLGINVQHMRFAGVTIGGALAGMGGFLYALTTAGCSANGDVAGFGFLAMAVLIFGNWDPIRIVGASFIFGMLKCVAASYFTLDLNGDGLYRLAELGISAHLYRMLPFIITLVVLAFTSKKSRGPKAAGKPFDLVIEQ